MKKFQILGKVLSKPEQKKILGGYVLPCGNRRTLSCLCEYPTVFGSFYACEGSECDVAHYACGNNANYLCGPA